MRFCLLILILASLTACEPVPVAPSSPEGGPGPLSPDQLKTWEISIAGAGRLERSILAGEDGADAGEPDPVLETLRDRADRDCLVEDRLRQADPEGEIKTDRLTVSGNRCPITINIKRTAGRGKIEIQGQASMVDRQLETRNGVSSFRYRAEGTIRPVTDGPGTRFRLHSTANITRAAGTVLTITGEADWRKWTDAEGANWVIGHRTLVFRGRGEEVTLTYEVSGGLHLHLMNGDPITARQFALYLSLLGPLLSGELSEAGWR